MAAREPYAVRSPHGERVDDYHWLRDDDPQAKRPEILRHLEAENAYTERVLAPLAPLRERLLREMRERVKPDDSTVPVYDHGWWVWRQFEPGNEHPRLMRRRGSPEQPDPAAKPELLLDLPRMAAGQVYFSIGSVALSPDGEWLAWTEDTTGRRSHTLRVQHLRTRRVLPHAVTGVLENLAWAADSRTLFYVRQDPVTLQSGPVWRHRRDTPAAQDQVVYTERDPTLFVDVRTSASRRQVLIDIQGSDVTELRAVPADEPAREPVVVLPRRAGVRAYADHLRGRWLIRTNEDAPNFRLVEAPEDRPARREEWRTLVPARDDAVLEHFEPFDRALALEERVDTRRRVRLIASDGRETIIEADAAGEVALGENRDPAAVQVRTVAQSLVQPPTTVDVLLADGRRILRRQETVAHFDPAQYRSTQLLARARDGTRVPVTLAWRPDRAAPDGRAPMLVEGYGAYGDSLDPDFAATRIPLLDRGFVVALAHVRGGGELGQAWADAGRLAHKTRSFDDFVDVVDHLVREGWGARDKVFAVGSSAGGLLVAAAVNRAPERFRGVALDVPFVDVLTTMLDPSIPLTTNEWSQWGDPREKADYDRLLSYSPYDNITEQAYPAMLVTTALWDSQVQFHEPAKYVARLRATRTDDRPVLLHTEMNAGHQGAPGRFERLQHWARQHAFFLSLAGIDR